MIHTPAFSFQGEVQGKVIEKALPHGRVPGIVPFGGAGIPIGRKYIQQLAVLRATDKFSRLYGLQARTTGSARNDRSINILVFSDDKIHLTISGQLYILTDSRDNQGVLYIYYEQNGFEINC